VSAHQAIYPVKTMCRLLDVSTSGYYTWRKRQPSQRAQEDQKLLKRIHAIHKRSKGTYGAPRIHAELAEAGVRVGRKRVARLMRVERLRGVSRRKAPHTTQRKPGARPAPDLVKRNFTASGPDRLWVADITYVATWAGWLYLAVVMDVWSRRVVGWAMSTHLRTSLVLDALQMAIRQRRPRSVIHHSDQGSQYTSLAFGQRCRAAGVRPSMGSVGDCYDNALCESFFATLECELLDRNTFHTPTEARLAIFQFIEGWYNPHRRHSALDYLSPNRYEAVQLRTP
jgi:putative transposase